MPPLPTRARPGLELRLHEQHEVGVGGGAAHERGRDGAQRDEGQVGDREVDRAADVLGLEVAGVGALEHRDPRVGAQRPRELTTPDVDREHRRRAGLEQAVGEPAGRRAEIEGPRARHRRPRSVERGGELLAATRHEAGRVPWSWIGSAGSTRRAGASARLPATSTLPALMASTA